MSKSEKNNSNKDMEDIKRLLVFILSKNDVVQTDLAKILKIDQSEVSRRYHLCKTKKRKRGDKIKKKGG